MAYTPTVWGTGNTVTPAALNKIENGIANVGEAGIPIAVIYFLNSTDGWQIEGDFNAALAAVQAKKPIFAFEYNNAFDGSDIVSWYDVVFLGVQYETEHSDRIKLFIDSGTGFYWTESGIEYYD